MTRKQRDVLKFVREFYLKNEYMPTCREIAVGMGMSPKAFSAISYKLNELVRQGHLCRNGKRYDFPNYRPVPDFEIASSDGRRELAKQFSRLSTEGSRTR